MRWAEEKGGNFKRLALNIPLLGIQERQIKISSDSDMFSSATQSLE